MTHSFRSWHITAISLTVGVFFALDAQAQTASSMSSDPVSDHALYMGEWVLKPSLELRTQGEFRHRPFDTGGLTTTYDSSGSVKESHLPIVKNQGWVLSRARLGLAVERGPWRAVIQWQDSRIWGESSEMGTDSSLPLTTARLAFAELNDSSTKKSYVRIGRQEIVWGNGRLLGASDWSPIGRSLDAVRGQLSLGNFEFEGFSSMLTSPGALPPQLRHETHITPEGSGVQLHGVRIAWHIAPLLSIESNNLARIARQPTQESVEPSDLFVVGGRVSGMYPGISYAAEGAYQVGRSALANTQNRQAFAFTGNARYHPGLLWNLGFGLEGAYASGQNKSKGYQRFDPILPDYRQGLGSMGLFTWSNTIEGAGLVYLSPVEDSEVTLGYHYVALAEPADHWQTAALTTIGKAPENTDRFLGHELDASLKINPWAPFSILAGYGAFLTGNGGKSILSASGRGQPSIQHQAYLQLTMAMP